MTVSATAHLAPLGRLARLRDLFESAGPDEEPVDALLVTTPANIRWLSGFSGSAGLLLVTRDHATLTTDGRYRTQSSEQLQAAGVSSAIEVRIWGVQAQREALVVASSEAKLVGLEADFFARLAQRPRNHPRSAA